MKSPGYKVFFFGQAFPGDTMEVTTLFVVSVSLDEEWKKEQERSRTQSPEGDGLVQTSPA